MKTVKLLGNGYEIGRHMEDKGLSELSAEIILDMPKNDAAEVIEAMFCDLLYWMSAAKEQTA